ncbi:MAG: SBBP repeat-containing protein [Patescibacteria group bacterium]
MRRTKRRLLSSALVGLLIALSLNLTPQFSVDDSRSNDEAALAKQFTSLPLAFEPNHGQANGAVQYLVHHGQATTFFAGATTTTTIGDGQVTMSLDGVAAPVFTGTDLLESKTNYFIGNDQSRWQSNVPNYQSILAKNVYPGIDLKYYGTNSQLEHDFIVNPGADYQQIAFHFAGHEQLSLDEEGNLVLKLANQELRLNAPLTYQQIGKATTTISSEFELNDNTVTIALNGEYDRSQPLVIDPILVYSTYLGGTSNDYAYNIAVDSTGAAYISGQSDNTSNFPIAGTPFQAANAGGSDGFVAKFNPSGSALVYSTYLGGSGIDWADGGIAVDITGNVYVSGNTDSSDFPTSSPFQGSYAGGGLDAFLTKLDSSGSSFVFSTYLGGSGLDWATGTLAIDSSDNIFMSGKTNSADFPTSSPFQGSNAGSYDAYVTMFDSSGASLTYSTYLGGSGNDDGQSITVDTTGNAYITGITDSGDFPINAAYQGAYGGGTSDAFLTKIDPTGASLVYSTYLGGTDVDEGYSVALDTSNNAYISGSTSSGDFPTASAYQSTYAGFSDVFVTKFDSTGSSLTYSTYLGGGSTDIGYGGLAVNSSGNAYVSGITASADFPILAPFQTTNAGGFDAFVTELGTTGTTLVYSTFLGGSSAESTFDGLVLDTSGNAYISGYTSSTDFPTILPYQGAHGGSTFDAFITVLAPVTSVVVTGITDPVLQFSLSSVICDLGIFSATQTKFCTHTMSAGTNAASGYVISYIPTTTLISGANTITAMATQTSSVLGSEQFGLNLRANTAVGSNTASAFGANPSGGSGSVMTGYELVDQFKFAVGGGNIAQTTVPSQFTTFTASFIANIEYATEPGTYSTPVTYTIVATY